MSAGKACDLGTAPDGSRPGTVYVNLYCIGIDTGIHDKHSSHERAIQYLKD